MRPLTRIVLGVAITVAALISVAVPASAAGIRQGSLSRTLSRTVVGRSNASGTVEHFYHSGQKTYVGPFIRWNLTSTPDRSTWWTVDYSLLLISADAFCVE